MKNLRHVEYSENETKIPLKKGLFHEWGTKAVEGIDKNIVSVTFAIIEDSETGLIHTVSPSDSHSIIRFSN